MSFNRRLASLVCSIRSLAIAIVCAVFLFVNVAPALAIGSTPSSPNEGPVRMKEILKESEDAVRPENALNSDKIIDRANSGLNEVQQDANEEIFNRPENSRQATSAAEQVQRAFEKAVDKVTGRD
jgi:hypothetical protein